MLLSLQSERQRVLSVVKLAEALPAENVLLRGEWAKYLSIVSSGYVEEGIRMILCEYVRCRTSAPISKFVASKIRDFQNPSPENIEKILSAFDTYWIDQLNLFWIDERRDAIASVVNNRHNAAHGRHFGTGLATIIRYFKRCDEVVVFLHGKILGERAAE